MPIPKSSPGKPITSAGFEQPFESTFTRFGVKGLNINDAIDAVEPDELTRMLNVTHRLDMSVTSRPGLSNITGAAVGTNHHSICRLNDEFSNTFTRLEGVDTSLYIGQGPLTSIDSGYSGNPLTFAPYRPPFSQQPWMYVADSARMRQVRSDGLDLPIGLPAPSTPATSALGTLNKTVIADLSSGGFADPTNWTGNIGKTYDTPPANVTPEILSPVTDDEGNPAIHFGALYPATTQTGYYIFYGCPITVDMSKVGAVDATDDDYIHVKLDFSHTQFVKEFRIYLVCSETFSPSILPGTHGIQNGDAYLKTFSANDFSSYIQAQLTQFDAAELARIRYLRDFALRESATDVPILRKQAAQINAQLDAKMSQAPVNTVTLQSSAASDMWQSFGVISIPLRRGDFQRMGQTAGRDWHNITGIITYIQTGPSGNDPVGTVAVTMSELYMNGGADPDTGDAADSPYDYRYTHYDTRTGAEGNPSPEMPATSFLDTLRREILVTPTAYGDPNLRQRFYRRGGTLPTDWFFVGTNSSDGGVFTDGIGDTEAAAANTVEIDNDQPISTVDHNGNTILNQPVSSLWGPLQDLLFACGDPYRPGLVYYCKPGNPNSWPPDNTVEVTTPSEPLHAGCLYGGQAFVFSTERAFVLYPNFGGESVSVTSTITQCTRGPINPWALTTGIGGIYFIAPDGIYRTVGGPEEWLSKKIDPIFRGKTKNGLAPIDFSDLTSIRLEMFENELYFLYKDTNGAYQTLVYSLAFQFWRQYSFNINPSVFYNDAENSVSTLLVGGRTTGKTYTLSGFSDDGAAISSSFRSRVEDFSRPRMEKRFGDQLLDLDTQGVQITLQNYLNNESIVNPVETFDAVPGRTRAIFDGFGTIPQRAFNINTDISWSSATAAPIIYQLGTTMIIEPDVTINRVTQWDDLGLPDASYIMGVTFDCDTGGQDRTIIVEGDYHGTITTIATLTVNCDGRHKQKFSWAGARANKVRIRPNDDCLAWQLFKCDWIFQPEPPDIAIWDSYFENAWDQYYTGLDLFCDTHGLNKTVEVYVDGVLIKTETVNTNGRLVHHITLPWGRGHVLRFAATDANPGILFDYRWHVQAEPSEQTNWNQNFTTQAALYDKYLKAVVFECDTFGQNKAVTVECDGVVVETLTINTNGRKVVQRAFAQHLGRVFRVYPVDDAPSRLYSLQFVFDGEPLALDRWETQEITHGLNGWHYPIYGHITIKASNNVNLQVIAYNQKGVAQEKNYKLIATGGRKVKQFVPFEATKGVLYKYVLTSDSPFWLYQEETTVFVRDWTSGRTADVHPFGDSDLDPTRNMINAELAAARPGGEA